MGRVCKPNDNVDKGLVCTLHVQHLGVAESWCATGSLGDKRSVSVASTAADGVVPDMQQDLKRQRI